MSFKHDAADSLAEIIENTKRVQRYISGMDRQAFGQTEWAQDAVERCIERVCEAVYRLGSRAEALMPGQPWNDIRGMGNRLRHGYDSISSGVIWDTAQMRLPELAAAAQRALAHLQKS